MCPTCNVQLLASASADRQRKQRPGRSKRSTACPCTGSAHRVGARCWLACSPPRALRRACGTPRLAGWLGSGQNPDGGVPLWASLQVANGNVPRWQAADLRERASASASARAEWSASPTPACCCWPRRWPTKGVSCLPFSYQITPVVTFLFGVIGGWIGCRTWLAVPALGFNRRGTESVGGGRIMNRNQHIRKLKSARSGPAGRCLAQPRGGAGAGFADRLRDLVVTVTGGVSGGSQSLLLVWEWSGLMVLIGGVVAGGGYGPWLHAGNHRRCRQRAGCGRRCPLAAEPRLCARAGNYFYLLADRRWSRSAACRRNTRPIRWPTSSAWPRPRLARRAIVPAAGRGAASAAGRSPRIAVRRARSLRERIFGLRNPLAERAGHGSTRTIRATARSARRRPDVPSRPPAAGPEKLGLPQLRRLLPGRVHRHPSPMPSTTASWNKRLGSRPRHRWYSARHPEVRGVARQFRAARIGVDQLRAFFHRVLDPRRRHRVIGNRIRADQKNHLGVLHIADLIRHRARS